MSRELIEAGKQYGVIKVVSAESDLYSKNKKWVCVCGKCGNTFCYIGSKIFKYQHSGCPDCRAKEKENYRVISLEKYNGMVFGELKVVAFSYMNKKNNPVMLLKCLKCGEDTQIPLSRLLANRASQCAKCSRKNLKVGHFIAKESCTDGTSLLAIDGRRTVNKNSSTGITGVSYMKSSQKYRAYICFKRRQYHLGLYDTIEDAVVARKIAEKQIYGSFLEWYAQTYPEKWEMMKKY